MHELAGGMVDDILALFSARRTQGSTTGGETGHAGVAMTVFRPANPSLHLYRVEIPWVEHTGPLLLATPRRRRLATATAGARGQEITEDLLNLRIQADFSGTYLAQHLWRLSARSTKRESGPQCHFSWPGWEMLVLPTGLDKRQGDNQNAILDISCQGAEGRLAISYLPSGPPATRDEWHHDLIRTLLEILALLRKGRGVLYLCLDGKSTAAFLPAALSILGRPEVHPQKALYPLQAAGLGLTPYQYGLFVGMGERGWELSVPGRWQ